MPQKSSMGLIASNSYLAVFSAGTLIGAASTYYILKLRHNWHKPKVKGDPVWSNGMEERYEVRRISNANTFAYKIRNLQFEDTDDEVRLILGVRNDLKMQKGKVAAQCGHGAMAAYAKTLTTSPQLLKNWLKNGKSSKKIIFIYSSDSQKMF